MSRALKPTRAVPFAMAKTGRRTSDHVVVAHRRRVWMGIGALALVVATAAILMLQPAAQRDLDSEHDPVLGSADAPLTIYYFADFQCPFCREFELTRLDALRADFVDTGRVQLVFKDFPIVGDDSWTAAEASQEVWTSSPDAYWAWHRAVYQAQGLERSGWASADGIVAISSQVQGVDANSVRAALDDHRHLAEARDDAAQASDAGVRATPTLVIEGRTYNALDDARVRAAIAEALAP